MRFASRPSARGAHRCDALVGLLALRTGLRITVEATNTPYHLPAEVWIAVPRGTRVPRVSARLRVVNISAAVFDLGIEDHRIDGHTVRVYSLARTVVDCFRFRNKVGLDVALEALSDAWRSKRLKLDELHRIAKKLRMQRVMQPYLEMVVL